MKRIVLFPLLIFWASGVHASINCKGGNTCQYGVVYTKVTHCMTEDICQAAGKSVGAGSFFSSPTLDRYADGEKFKICPGPDGPPDILKKPGEHC